MSFAGYDVSVHEFPGRCTGLEIHDGRVLFAYGPRVAELDGDQARVLVEEPPNFLVGFRIEGDVLYTSQRPLDDVYQPTLFKRRSIHDLTHATSHEHNLVWAMSAGNRHVYYDEKTRGAFRWISVDHEGLTTDLVCKGTPVGDEDSVFFQTNTELLRLTPDLRERLWSKETAGTRHLGVRPVVHEAFVILVTEAEGGGDTLFVVDKVTGERVWRRDFASPLLSMRVCDGRILALERHGEIWALNPGTGTVLGAGNSGLSHGPLAGNSLLWSDGRSLFVVSRGGRTARAFSMEASHMLQEIRLPKPYDFGVGQNVIAVGPQGEIYWVCPSHGELSYHSFLIAVLTPRSGRGPAASNGLNVDVRKPPWPVDVRVCRVPSVKKGKVHYHLTARAELARDVERYAQIGLRWMVVARAGAFDGDHRKDSRFDGSVLLSWEAEHDGPARIERMLDEVRHSFGLAKGEWLKFSTAPMPESVPGEEQPIGVLTGELRFQIDSWFEKMPMSITFLSGRAMEVDAYEMLDLRKAAIAYGKRQGRRRFRGAELAFRECSGIMRYSVSDRTGRVDPTTMVLYDNLDKMTLDDFAKELRLGAAEAYRRIGMIFFDEQDCAEWFSYLSKLARNLCKKAPKGDPGVSAVFELVDGLADEGRSLSTREPERD
jgi:hypothetical protein